MADRSPAPAASLLYEGATHFHGGSPAAVVGPYIRTEIADWLLTGSTVCRQLRGG